MLKKPDEEFVKEEGQDITEKDVEKAVDKSEEIKKKFKTRGPLALFMEDARPLKKSFGKNYAEISLESILGDSR